MKTELELKRGVAIRDNDPRMKRRVFIVSFVTADGQVGYQGKTRFCWLKRDRVFTDGKKRAQGWNVLTREQALKHFGSFGEQGKDIRANTPANIAAGTAADFAPIK